MAKERLWNGHWAHSSSPPHSEPPNKQQSKLKECTCHANAVSKQVPWLYHYPTLRLAAGIQESGSAVDMREMQAAGDWDSVMINCWTVSHRVKWKDSERKKITMTLEKPLYLSDIWPPHLFLKNLKIKANTFESQCFPAKIKTAYTFEIFCLLSFSL